MGANFVRCSSKISDPTYTILPYLNGNQSSPYLYVNYGKQRISNIPESCSFIGSCVDVYCLPRKRARTSAPFAFSESEFECDNQPSIGVLPEECLFEIFSRLPSGKERSSATCVSKRWLMLLNSIRKAEFCKTKSIGSANLEKGAVASVSNDIKMTCVKDGDWYLTR
ncbi:hypothetical protein ACOSP7_019691 [Xanthoceras sorbifolium]